MHSAVHMLANGESSFQNVPSEDDVAALLRVTRSELTPYAYGDYGVIYVITKLQTNASVPLNRNASTVLRRAAVRGDAVCFPRGLPWQRRELADADPPEAA